MISVQNLYYAYPGSQNDTLNGLSFDIADTEIFGFLGPSGAGKSTVQKILIGLLKNYRGEISVLGSPLKLWGTDYAEYIGVSFETPNHYLKLSAYENLQFFSNLYQGDKLDPKQVLEWVDLHEDANKPVFEYSKGMKIRLNVARSIIHKPKLLFLDEPTAGLDPVNAKRIKELILRLRDEGATICIATHNMALADTICDRVAFITQGHVSVIDKPASLKKKYGERSVKVEYLNGSKVIQSQNFPIVGLGDNSRFIELLNQADRIETIHTNETTLDHVFIKVTGRELEV